MHTRALSNTVSLLIHINFLDLNLPGDVLSIYTAGTDTSTESLYWAIAYMVVFQERIYTEIKQTVGKESKTYLKLLQYVNHVV